MKHRPLVTVPLITPDNRKAFFWPAAFILYFAYTLSGYNAFAEPWHPRVTSFDVMVPFLPETVWIYLSHIAMLFTGWWWMAQGPACTRAFWALVLCFTIATAYFLVYPTEIPRLTLASIDADPFTRGAWAFLLAADKPTNCFPSLHVALSAITALGLVRAAPRWSPWAPLWTASIALSTITTRQHVWVDVLGGLVLAYACWWVVERWVAVRGDALPAGTQDTRRQPG